MNIGLNDRQKAVWQLCLLIVIYVVSRWSHFSREYVFEEPYNFMAGRRFWESGVFSMNMGEINSLVSPFHKPPLTMLVGGLFSFIGSDGLWGIRLLSFLCGLVAVLLPYFYTKNIVASLMMLLSPFLFAGSSHFQIDPTMGLLGYSMVSVALYLWCVQRQDGHFYVHFYFGFLILWLSKIEILVFALILWSLVLLIWKKENAKGLWLSFVKAQSIGFLSLAVLCVFLGKTSGLDAHQSFLNIFVQIQTVVMDTLVSDQVYNPELSHRRRQLMLDSMKYYNLFAEVVFFFVAPVLASLAIFRGKVDVRSLLLLLAGALPFAAYFVMAWNGDGFPRYFLISFVPWAFYIGHMLNSMQDKLRSRIAAVLLVMACLFSAPRTFELMFQKSSVTVLQGYSGLRDAATFLKQKITPKHIVAIPEWGIPYFSGLRYAVSPPKGFSVDAAIVDAKEVQGEAACRQGFSSYEVLIYNKELCGF